MAGEAPTQVADVETGDGEATAIGRHTCPARPAVGLTRSTKHHATGRLQQAHFRRAPKGTYGFYLCQIRRAVLAFLHRRIPGHLQHAVQQPASVDRTHPDQGRAQKQRPHCGGRQTEYLPLARRSRRAVHVARGRQQPAQ